MSVLAELKRRNVIRVAAAYLALGWVVTEVASTITPLLNLPGWLPSVVVWIGIFGFPVILAFAWVYELTPEGLKRESEVAREDSITRQTGRRLDLLTIMMVVAAVGVVMTDRYLLHQPAEKGGPAETVVETPVTPESVVGYSPPRTIAVLPFLNLGGNADNEYFSDGLTEELINRIGKIPGLRVTARTSAFSYKGSTKDVRDIGQALAVATVLEGGVRRTGDRVRITAQLIDTHNGYELWSDSYERDLRDIFAIQNEITNRIAQVVGIQVGETMPRKPTASVEAYEWYLRGRTVFAQRTSEAQIRQAIAHFEQALALDPSFVSAQAGLAAALNVLPNWIVETSFAPSHLNRLGTAMRERAGDLARSVLTVEPTNSEAHAVLAVYYSEYRCDYIAAEEAFRAALQANPNNATAHLWYGTFLGQTGRLRDQLREVAEALRLDPASPVVNGAMASAEMDLNHLDEAERYLSMARQLGSSGIDFGLGEIALLRGDPELAKQKFDLHAGARGLPSVADEIVVPPEKRAVIAEVVKRECAANLQWRCYWRFAYVEDYGAALEVARTYYDRGCFIPWPLWHPTVAKIRRHPEFKPLVRHIGLVDYWRKYGWADHCTPAGEDFDCR